MSIINILDNGEGVEIVFIGVVNGTEIIQTRNKIYAYHIFTKYKYYIVNQSQCTELNVTADDIAAIAELDIQASRINPGLMIAIIESQYLQFNFTDAWQAHVEDHISKVKSFNDRCAALNWLKHN